MITEENGSRNRWAQRPSVRSVLIVWTLSFFYQGLGSPVRSGPLFDPFLEKFQVGTYQSPEDFPLAGGFPAGLIEPPHLDHSWLRSAALCLAEEQPPDFASSLLHRRFLRHMMPFSARQEWRRTHRELLAEFSGSGPAQPLPRQPDENPFLLAERINLAVFQAIDSGHPARAAGLAAQLATVRGPVELPACDRLIWGLRQDLFEVMAGLTQAPDNHIWPGLTELGPYDSNNAWALWLAFSRDRGIPPLPTEAGDRQWVRWLGGLRMAWLEPDEFRSAGFSEAEIAGLGATLLPTRDLEDHFERHPRPPEAFTLQGWWVKGQRFRGRGQADWYEQLAARDDLNPAWRLDVWRRASEVRLLAGQWDAGLQDLRQALALHGQASASGSLRRRLREWVEQSLVLFLARGDTARAAEAYAQGVYHLQGDDLDRFIRETSHWAGRIRGIPAAADTAQDRLSRAAQLVQSGRAPALGAVAPQRVGDFLAAANRPIWEIWCRWGLALAPSADESRPVSARRDLYHTRLLEIQAAPAGTPVEELVAEAVADRFAGTQTGEDLLRRSLLLDINRTNGWNSPQDQTPLVDLVQRHKDQWLDLHALLGFALMTGDMRGALAASVVLPTRSLSLEEKLRFLYPLPGPGPIRDAVAAAQSDPALLLAVARNESLFDPAVRSRAGALGWMQIMPFHFQDRGARPGPDNWSHPGTSIPAGDRLLVENMRRYQGDPYRTLAAYNAGPQAVARWLQQLGGQADPEIFLAWIGYPETRRYVEKVLIDRVIYDWIIASAVAP